jgi:hypothetical protein
MNTEQDTMALTDELYIRFEAIHKSRSWDQQLYNDYVQSLQNAWPLVRNLRAERDHWHSFVSRADRTHFPFDSVPVIGDQG